MSHKFDTTNIYWKKKRKEADIGQENPNSIKTKQS